MKSVLVYKPVYIIHPYKGRGNDYAANLIKIKSILS